MKRHTRKVIALLGAPIIVVAILVWAFFASELFMELSNYQLGLSSEFAEDDAVYMRYMDYYSSLSAVVLAVAAGLSFAFLIWERRQSRFAVELLYWLLLLLIMPIVFTAYLSLDLFVSRSRLALLNLVVAFLGVACVWSLASIKAEEITAKVLKFGAIVFLSMQAVFIPTIYSVLWWLNWQSAISLAQTNSLAPGWISTLSGIGGLVVAVLQYLAGRAPINASRTDAVIFQSRK